MVPIYGGQEYQAQFRQLDRGVHVVVGTPGRVMDHIRRGSLSLQGLQGLVLDEADEMLRMGFVDDVEWVLSQAPAERQIALFSATMPSAIRQIAQRHLRNPAEITIKRGAFAADTVRQRFVVVAAHQKQAALSRILEGEEIDGVLIFVKTKSTTEPLAEFLSTQGHRTAALSSDVPQKQREKIISGLRSGHLDIVIATDVAARGLDVQRISHVINYDLPFDSESYVHRIGGTGRAGRGGEAILFVHPREQFLLRRIEQATRQSIEAMQVPSKRVINQRRVARFHERITSGMAHPELSVFAKLVEQYREQNEVPLEQIAAALAALAAGDKPLLLSEDLKPSDFIQSRSPSDARGHRSEDGRRKPPFARGERNFVKGRPQGQMETFRIELGHAHQVKPANIVGAIANETGLDSANIGRIEIFDEFSTVDLLVGMPTDVFHQLKQVYIAGRRLNITRVHQDGAMGQKPSPAAKPKTKAKKRKAILAEA